MPVQAADAAPATTIVLKAAHVFDSTTTTLRDGAIVKWQKNGLPEGVAAARPPQSPTRTSTGYQQ